VGASIETSQGPVASLIGLKNGKLISGEVTTTPSAIWVVSASASTGVARCLR
jgi:hypothetical protein